MKKLVMLVVAIAVVNSFGGCSDESSSSGYINEDAAYATPAYPEVQETSYEEETEAWSDTHTTAPVPDSRVNGEDYLGAWVTADGSSDIYFYELNGQRYYEATINGVYYEGRAEVYETHGAIYCLDGSKNDGTIAVSFYMSYNDKNEMSPYELYEQTTGTGFYWHH